MPPTYRYVASTLVLGESRIPRRPTSASDMPTSLGLAENDMMTLEYHSQASRFGTDFYETDKLRAKLSIVCFYQGLVSLGQRCMQANPPHSMYESLTRLRLLERLALSLDPSP